MLIGKLHTVTPRIMDLPANVAQLIVRSIAINSAYTSRVLVGYCLQWSIRCVMTTKWANKFFTREQRVLAIAILSVCLSHGWISQKRCRLESPNLHLRLPGRI